MVVSQDAALGGQGFLVQGQCFLQPALSKAQVGKTVDDIQRGRMLVAQQSPA